MVKITGMLKYSDNGEYEVVCNGKTFNFSKLLDSIHRTKSNYINLRITDGNDIVFYKDGHLYKAKDRYGMYSYYILGNNLEDKLFNNTDNTLEFTIHAWMVGEDGSYEKLITE